MGSRIPGSGSQRTLCSLAARRVAPDPLAACGSLRADGVLRSTFSPGSTCFRLLARLLAPAGTCCPELWGMGLRPGLAHALGLVSVTPLRGIRGPVPRRRTLLGASENAASWARPGPADWVSWVEPGRPPGLGETLREGSSCPLPTPWRGAAPQPPAGEEPWRRALLLLREVKKSVWEGSWNACSFSTCRLLTLTTMGPQMFPKPEGLLPPPLGRGVGGSPERSARSHQACVSLPFHRRLLCFPVSHYACIHFNVPQAAVLKRKQGDVAKGVFLA